MVGLGGLEPPTVPYLDTALPVYKTGSLPLSYSPLKARPTSSLLGCPLISEVA